MRDGAHATAIASITGTSVADATATTRWRPTVTLHYAQSLDGRIATRTGAAQWISGDASTRFAHELRAASGAVIIGSGTALSDDPLLTVRLVAGKQPLRVVLDARGRLPRNARLANDTTSPTVVATCAPALQAPNVERWQVPSGEDGEGVDLAAVLRRLREQRIDSVLVEGGGRVITSFLRAGLVDRIIVSIAPIVLGAGVEAVGDLHIEQLDQAKRFTTRKVWRLGDDVMIELAARRD
jgi:riboflavin-specific deaminase-like protein